MLEDDWLDARNFAVLQSVQYEFLYVLKKYSLYWFIRYLGSLQKFVITYNFDAFYGLDIY